MCAAARVVPLRLARTGIVLATACLLPACALFEPDPAIQARKAEQAALVAAPWPESPPAPADDAPANLVIKPPVPKPAYKPGPPAEAESGQHLASVTLNGGTRTVSLPDMDLKRLIGLSQTDTFAMLGTPTDVREQSPATVWSYDIGACLLDLYFYMDLGTNAFRVLTLDVRDTVSSEGGKQSCPAPANAASRAR